MEYSKFTRKLQPYFWLALLVHLLLLLGFSLSLLDESDQAFEKKSDKYLPAYLYPKENNASAAATSTAQDKSSEKTKPEVPKASPEKIALKKQELPQKQKSQQETPPINSIQQPKSLSSSAFIQAESPTTGKPNDEPLLKELSRATAAKLFYPIDAAAFKLKGTATVSFLLYPDGRVTNVTLEKSSGFRILDDAALATIRAISPVRDANLYLTKPRTLLAGIIFG